jgi:hypothetical protein
MLALALAAPLVIPTGCSCLSQMAALSALLSALTSETADK